MDGDEAFSHDFAGDAHGARGPAVPEHYTNTHGGVDDDNVVLTQYVIYERPRDFPNHWVVLAWDIVRGQLEPTPHGDVVLADSLEAARDSVPPGLIRLGRNPSDEQTIVEVWT